MNSKKSNLLIYTWSTTSLTSSVSNSHWIERSKARN